MIIFDLINPISCDVSKYKIQHLLWLIISMVALYFFCGFVSCKGLFLLSGNTFLLQLPTQFFVFFLNVKLLFECEKKANEFRK